MNASISPFVPSSGSVIARLERAADAAGYPLPDLDADYRYEPVRAEIAAIQSRGLAAMAMLECTVFERAWYLRSMERLLPGQVHGKIMYPGNNASGNRQTDREQHQPGKRRL